MMIGNEEKQVLADLVDVVSSLDLPMILIGAGARLLVFDQKFGKGRGTKDWDVAIAIDSWESYQNLREALSTGNSSCFKSTKAAHKFTHTETGIEVDIVPFGEIGEPDKKIIWIDSGNVMNVAGFAEALLHAKHISIGDIEIPVVDTPCFIVLKIFAWGDRSDRTNKDLADIDFVLSKYKDEERVYSELATELAEGSIDFLDGNVYLLGQDIHKILQAETLDSLKKLLSRLIETLATKKVGTLRHRLKVLQAGMCSKER